jgi:hypothetical protein
MDLPLLSPAMSRPFTGNLDLNAAYEAQREVKKGPPVPPQVVQVERRMGYMFKIAVVSTILFVLLSHNMAYKIANHIYTAITSKNDVLMTDEGCPTVRGILLNAGIFFLIIMVVTFRG